MVRRILHNSGHSVIALHRYKYGDIELLDLLPGKLRICEDNENLWARDILNNHLNFKN
jgi:16S rRNA U516 pseudouridylate synthase RsuA-like enzyme